MGFEEDKKLATEFLKKEIKKLEPKGNEPVIVLGNIALTPKDILWEINKGSEIGKKHAKIIAKYVRKVRKND